MTDRTTKTVTIIGAGIDGLYLIAQLGVAGFKLRLHDINESKLSETRAIITLTQQYGEIKPCRANATKYPSDKLRLRGRTIMRELGNYLELNLFQARDLVRVVLTAVRSTV